VRSSLRRDEPCVRCLKNLGWRMVTVLRSSENDACYLNYPSPSAIWRFSIWLTNPGLKHVAIGASAYPTKRPGRRHPEIFGPVFTSLS